MMRVLILVHRWLGVALCLFFAMWFATGIVMHFVPFPALTEAERVSGLQPIMLKSALPSPLAAVQASDIANVARVRLIARDDGLVYVLEGADRIAAVRADDLSSAQVRSEKLALSIAIA